MAHNIYQDRNGKFSVFVVGEPAWHRLGKVLDRPLTSEQAIIEAGLDYEVEKAPVYIKSGDTSIAVPSRYATVRKDTNTPLGIVGDRYTVLQNSEAFKFFDDVVGGNYAMYHSAGALGSGSRIWLMAKLPKDIIVANTDVVEQYMVLTNSHDGSGTVQMYYTPIRVVCQNTLTASLHNQGKKINIRHTATIAAKVSTAKKALGLMFEYEKSFEPLVQSMADTRFSVLRADEYFTQVLGGEPEETEGNERTLSLFRNQKEKLLALFDNGVGNANGRIKHTAWTAYNAVTEYVDYHRTCRGGSDEKRLQSIWFGSGAELKARAFSMAQYKGAMGGG